MFNKREARIRFVKPDTAENTASGESKILPPETVKLIAERSKDVAKYVAITVIGVYGAVKAIDTLSEVIVKKTKSADNK